MDNSKETYLLGEAARYRARLSAHDCSEQEREDCERWCRADPLHAEALRRVEAAASQADRAIQEDARLQRMVERAYRMGAFEEKLPEIEAPNSARLRAMRGSRARRIGFRTVENRTIRRSKFGIPAAVAAGALVAICAAWSVARWHDESAARTAPAMVLAAPAKSPRQVTLEDGSVAHIDVGGKISVAFAGGKRRIEILSGTAFFEVAHDKTRPFVVTANGTQTVALGTQFQVQRGESGATVTLLEGSVAVGGSDGRQGWSERLRPGEQLQVSAGGTIRERLTVDAAAVTSWSKGWLVFHGTSLGEALREINRYSSKRVSLGDAALADLSVAGSFIAGDSQSIVTAIAEVLPIRVVDAGSSEIILFKRYDE